MKSKSDTKTDEKSDYDTLLRGGLTALTTARQRLLSMAQAMDHGPLRLGVMQSRSELGLMMEELEMEREPNDTTVDLMIAWSVMGAPND